MIEKIINDELIEIHFQPIVSIRTKSIFAFESLTRCTYEGENIPPNVLFNLAEEKNLNIRLDEITRNKAIRKFHKYYEKDNNLILFLNFESTLIDNFDIENSENSFLDVINKLNIPYENFVLEIKEDEISNIEALKAFCKVYKNLGFSIALDDFGTGSSNFDRIDLIRPDIIKIDKSLFNDIKTNLVNREVVRAIAKMSHNLGIEVLAEGVEERDSISVGLKTLINLFQGYYFCKPSFEIDEKQKEELIEKILEIGKYFKNKAIRNINKKREFVFKYESIADEMIKKIFDIDSSNKILREEFKKFNEIEAIYLIDTKTSRQINDTIIDTNVNKTYRPTKHNEEHFLKEYYYITLESKQGSFLSQKYISYASGNVCKTFTKRFELDSVNSVILCLDIVVEGK